MFFVKSEKITEIRKKSNFSKEKNANCSLKVHDLIENPQKSRASVKFLNKFWHFFRRLKIVDF